MKSRLQDGNLLENDVLAGEVSIDRRESVELVLEVVLVLRVKVAKISRQQQSQGVAVNMRLTLGST